MVFAQDCATAAGMFNIPLHYILPPVLSLVGGRGHGFDMRAELPWNVAGIPPEAREAARAAARREGLSVGEWLTRRILRSFSDLGEERDSMPNPDRTNLDAWGLPQSAASRRDTEDM